MGGCGQRGLRLESRDRGSRDAGDMTDLQQYRLRLALSVPPSFAFALTGMSIPDLFYKDQTINGLWNLFAITFGILNCLCVAPLFSAEGKPVGHGYIPTR